MTLNKIKSFQISIYEHFSAFLLKSLSGKALLFVTVIFGCMPSLSLAIDGINDENDVPSFLNVADGMNEKSPWLRLEIDRDGSFNGAIKSENLFRYNGVEVRITPYKGSIFFNPSHDGINHVTFKSTAFISAVEICGSKDVVKSAIIEKNLNGGIELTREDKKFKGGENCFWYSLPKSTFSVSLGLFDFCIRKIQLNTENLVNIEPIIKQITSSMVTWYQSILRNLNVFEKNIKTSDKRHLARLRKSLEIASNSMIDANGKIKLPATHTIVQENARIILVLATVLNELLNEYEGVATLKSSIESLKSVSRQIRTIYGWNEGLAGSASKAMTALGYAIDLEVRGLYEYASAVGADPKAFNELIKSINAVIRKSLAMNGGDAAVNIEVQEFAKVWNGEDIQTTISSLFNAHDISNITQPKLKRLFMALESISDLNKVEFNLPEDILNDQKGKK